MLSFVSGIPASLSPLVITLLDVKELGKLYTSESMEVPRVSDFKLVCPHINIPYGQIYSPGENFRQFRHLLALAKFLSHEFFDGYTEDMATFTALAKIYSSEYFCNARVAGIGEIFVQRKFSAIRYHKFINSSIIARSLLLLDHWPAKFLCLLKLR